MFLNCETIVRPRFVFIVFPPFEPYVFFSTIASYYPIADKLAVVCRSRHAQRNTVSGTSTEGHRRAPHGGAVGFRFRSAPPPCVRPVRILFYTLYVYTTYCNLFSVQWTSGSQTFSATEHFF